MTPEQLWLYERPKLEEYLRRRLSRQDTEDIVDETFARLKGEEITSGLLWGTALKVELEHQRAQVRTSYLEEQVSILGGRAVPGIEKTAILRIDFNRAFRDLPRTQQEAFALVELRGLTEHEAAGVLGVPRDTVHWRCETARSRLREELS